MLRRSFLLGSAGSIAEFLTVSQSTNTTLDSLTRDILKNVIEVKSGEGIAYKPLAYRRIISTSLSGGILSETAAPRLYGQAEVKIDNPEYTATIKANVFYDEANQRFVYDDRGNSLEVLDFTPKMFNGQRKGAFRDNSADGVADSGETNLSGTLSFIRILQEKNPQQFQNDYVQALNELKVFYDSLKSKDNK